MNYEVTDLQFGLYDCDTLFIKIDKDIVQVPVSKKANVTKELIGKLITIEYLYNVPLEKVILAKISFDKH